MPWDLSSASRRLLSSTRMRRGLAGQTERGKEAGLTCPGLKNVAEV